MNDYQSNKMFRELQGSGLRVFSVITISRTTRHNLASWIAQRDLLGNVEPRGSATRWKWRREQQITNVSRSDYAKIDCSNQIVEGTACLRKKWCR